MYHHETQHNVYYVPAEGGAEHIRVRASRPVVLWMIEEGRFGGNASLEDDVRAGSHAIAGGEGQIATCSYTAAI